MSDNPDAVITILQADVALALRQIDMANAESNCISPDPSADDAEIQFMFEGAINRPDLAQDWLTVQCIPFDRRTDGSYEHGDFYQHLRFDAQGNAIHLDYYEEDTRIPVDELATVIEEHPKPEEAMKRVRGLVADVYRRTVAMPWDDQITNSKIARTRQLITS